MIMTSLQLASNMSNQRGKELPPQSYCVENLKNARSYLQNNIKQLRFCSTFEDLNPSLPNVWEGEEGMMKHMESDFPMPPRMSMSANKWNKLALYKPTFSINSSSFRTDSADSYSLPANPTRTSPTFSPSTTLSNDLTDDHQSCFPDTKKDILHVSASVKPPDIVKTCDLGGSLNSPPCPEVIVIEDDDVLVTTAKSTNSLQCTSSVASTIKKSATDERNNSEMMPFLPWTSLSSKLQLLSKKSKQEGAIIKEPATDEKNNSEVMPFLPETRLSSELQLVSKKSKQDGASVIEPATDEKNNSEMMPFLPVTSLTSELKRISKKSKQDGASIVSMYLKKIDEWRNVFQRIQEQRDLLQPLLTTVPRVCTENVYKSWRSACFLIECLNADMEIARMPLKPTTQGSLFPDYLMKRIGVLKANKISKQFFGLKSVISELNKTFHDLFHANRNLFRKYNQEIKNEELKIKVPILLSLSKRKHSILYRQKKPLISPMTPGLSAGFYGTGASLLDRLTMWLTHINQSAESKCRDSVLSKSPPTVSIEKPKCHGQDANVSANSQVVHRFNPLVGDKCNNTISVSSTVSPVEITLDVDSSPSLIDPRSKSVGKEKLKKQSPNFDVELVAHKASEAGVDAAALFDTKFTEWERRVKHIQNVFHGTRKKLTALRNKNEGSPLQIPLAEARTLAELTYLIEHLHFQMDLERITLTPNSVKKEWLFSETIELKLGKQNCQTFRRRYKTIRRNQGRLSRGYLQLFRLFKMSIRQYNRKTSKGQLQVAVPTLISLSKSDHFAKILKAKTSRAVISKGSPGLEAAFFGKQQSLTQVPPIPLQDMQNSISVKIPSEFLEVSNSIDLSVCHIRKYDEESIRLSGKCGLKLCADFENLHHHWKAQAMEVEKSLGDAKVVLLDSVDIDISSNLDAHAVDACRSLVSACSSIHMLYSQYVCAKLSQQFGNYSIKWRFSKPVCKLMDQASVGRLSAKFNVLYGVLKDLGRTFNRVCDLNKSVILQYNEQVEKSQCVRLPMSVQAISHWIRDLHNKGSLVQMPL